MNRMSIEDMKKYEWVVSWSGGKDSTATIILMHENNIPIKKIVYCRMMYDENTPATLPIMTDFVDNAKHIFENWGYDVVYLYPDKTMCDLQNRKYKRSKKENFNGNYYGITAFMRGFCGMTHVKQTTLERFSKNVEGDMIMVGYACDEYARLDRLINNKYSIMLELGITESATYGICSKYDLLSPLYDLGIKRDGCWFCPNAGKIERGFLKKNYPHLVDKIYNSIKMCDYIDNEMLQHYATRNNWLRDYLERQPNAKS